jgi:predicted dehydrogenase
MIRIGIVGCGRILNAHLQGFQRLREKGLDQFRITALCARNEADAWMFHTPGKGPSPRPAVLPPETGDPLAAPHTYLSDFQNDVEVRVFTDYLKMIESGVCDAVLDTSTLALHHQVALAAFDAGLHVLTQKPLAISVRAAKLMVETARKKRLSLGTFENVRQARRTRAVRWALEKGLLGEPQMALLGSLGGVWSPNRIVADTLWRHDKLQAAAGGSIDIGVHQMHWLRYVIGEVRGVQALTRTFEPERVLSDEAGAVTKTVRANVDDTYFAGVVFDNGAIAQLLWSWAVRGSPLAIAGLPAVFGSKGCIQGDQLLPDGAEPESLLERFERELSDADRERYFPLGLLDPYAILQLDFLRAISSGSDPETSGEEGLCDLACAMAIAESALAGRFVTLQEMLSGSVRSYQADIDSYYGV